MIRFFNPALTYQKHKEEFDAEIQRVLNAGDLILRDAVANFEKTLAEYVGVKYAVGLNSATDALYLALRGLGIGQGDEVLVPSRTFVATAQVIVQVGATPVYIDLDGDFEITPKTKAIIPVHIEGAFGADMYNLLDICSKKGIYIIEDAAQALGATQNGKKAGSFGIAGAFSFYPAKILGSLLGDAGALVTNDEKLYNWVKGARNHFKETAEDWGVNSRLDNPAAAILNVRFKYLPEILVRRQEIAEMYNDGLLKLNIENKITLPQEIDGRVWQDFIIRTESRNELFDYLKENGVESMKNNYPFPVPKLPQAQKYEDETLRLPISEVLEDKEVFYIIKKVKDFFNNKPVL